MAGGARRAVSLDLDPEVVRQAEAMGRDLSRTVGRALELYLFSVMTDEELNRVIAESQAQYAFQDVTEDDLISS